MNNLVKRGFIHCTAIQELTFSAAFKGHDVVGQAQTGSGKTLAFLIAGLTHLLSCNPPAAPHSHAPRMLIIAPTRELALQIYREVTWLLQGTALRAGIVYGGAAYEAQLQTLNSGIDILVGTVGRLIDFFKQKVVLFSSLEILVLDEVDRLFHLGFMKDLRYLLQHMPAPNERRSFFFSATLSHNVKELAFEQMNNPLSIEVTPEDLNNKLIREELFYPSSSDKLPLLQTLLEEEWPEKLIIFTNTKQQAEHLWACLQADAHRAGLLTGDIPQSRRISVLKEFTNGSLDILVATDIAARGLDIPQVSHIVNYDLPDDPEAYVHRIGRTGRAGATGHAISFACEMGAFNLNAIEQYLGYALPISHYEPKALIRNFPKPKLGQRQKRNNPKKNPSS